MSSIQILHNPRCSKSRQTLALLEENGISPEIILYLEQTPSTADLTLILEKLGLKARDIIRTGEEAYKDLNLKDSSHTEAELIQAMTNAERRSTSSYHELKAITSTLQ